MAVKTEIIGDTTYWNGVPMPFVTPGVVAGEWRLTRAYYFAGVLPDGRAFRVWICEGFTFDGASIPRSLWRVCGAPMEIPRIAAALIHDWLYRAQVCDRALADEIFNSVCKTVGMASWRTGPEWTALRAFGGSAWNENRKEWAKVSAARELGSFEIEGEKKNMNKKLCASLRLGVSALIFSAVAGCGFRSIELVRTPDGYDLSYLNIGLKTDVTRIGIERSTNGTIRCEINGVATDVSAENKRMIEAGGTAVGNIAEKVVEGLK